MTQDQDVLDCTNSTQRLAQGSDALKAERSTNYSVGLVLTPLDSWTITLDYWSIEKEDTIGLLGEENHTVLDLLGRLEHGPGNCEALQANPAVARPPILAMTKPQSTRQRGYAPRGSSGSSTIATPISIRAP